MGFVSRVGFRWRGHPVDPGNGHFGAEACLLPHVLHRHNEEYSTLEFLIF